MSTDREDLVRLVEELPDDQVSSVLAAVRRVANQPAFFASAPGSGRRIAGEADDLFAEGFGR